MKSKIFILIGLVILLFVTVNLFGKDRIFPDSKDDNPNKPDEEVTFCTLDAKMCPDGSYVGRIGPKCEFAECPKSDQGSMSGKETVTTSLNKESQTIGGLSIIPVEVLEDSRCPSDVVCIQAGTVRLKVNINNGPITLESIVTLNQTVSIDSKSIELVDVKPETVSTKPIKKEDYLFTFKISEYVPEQM